jgi:bloom syndrome protein
MQQAIVPPVSLDMDLLRQDIKQKLKLEDDMDHYLKELLQAFLSGKDTFHTTQSDSKVRKRRSVCFQVLSHLHTRFDKGIILVISPFVARMNEEAEYMRLNGIKSFALSGKMKIPAQRAIVECSIKQKTPNGSPTKIIYMTPEFLHYSEQARNFLNTLYHQGRLARLLLDEAHCISSMSSRLAIKKLWELRERFPTVPISCFSATATYGCRASILQTLQIDSEDVIQVRTPLDRPNLVYKVEEKNKGIHDSIFTFIEKSYRQKAGIIYCHSRSDANNVTEELKKRGILAEQCHAGVQDREALQKQWKDNEFHVMVVSGILLVANRPDVRYIIHHTMPRSIEQYYEETSQAGKDLRTAVCILFYNNADKDELTKEATFGTKRDRYEGLEDIIPVEQKGGSFNSNPESSQNVGAQSMSVDNAVRCQLKKMIEYARTYKCRRQQLLAFLGEEIDQSSCAGKCDVCSKVYWEDVTQLASELLHLIDTSSKIDYLTLPQLKNGFVGSHSSSRREARPLRGYEKAAGLTVETVEKILTDLQIKGIIGLRRTEPARLRDQKVKFIIHAVIVNSAEAERVHRGDIKIHLLACEVELRGTWFRDEKPGCPGVWSAHKYEGEKAMKKDSSSAPMAGPQSSQSVFYKSSPSSINGSSSQALASSGSKSFTRNSGDAVDSSRQVKRQRP